MLSTEAWVQTASTAMLGMTSCMAALVTTTFTVVPVPTKSMVAMETIDCGYTGMTLS